MLLNQIESGAGSPVYHSKRNQTVKMWRVKESPEVFVFASQSIQADAIAEFLKDCTDANLTLEQQ
jgi:hypothetical protein